MSNRLTITAILSTLFILCGCTIESEPEAQYKQRLVVDGRIENGRSAIVMLSLSHPYQEEIDTSTLQDMIVRWAKVTVSDSQRSEILTGRYDENYPTQFIYTGSEIIGQEGESYSIRIDYSGHTWSATTTIPPSTTLENIALESTDDEHFTISATVPPADGYPAYMIDCSTNNSPYLIPTMMGIFDGIQASRDIPILPPLDLVNERNYTPVFNKADTITLRVATMSEASYNYWIHWENNLINTFNPLFPPQSNPPSNLSGDALGLWSGYGCSYYKVRFNE